MCSTVYVVVRVVCSSVHPLKQWRLWVTIAGHFAIDFISVTLLPLLTIIEGRFELSNTQGAYLLGLGSIASGVVQPFIGRLSDHHDTRIFGIAGLIVAGCSYALIPVADVYWQLMLIQLFACVGIGAFHPVSASAVGNLSGGKRTLGIALFFVGGMSGHAFGNVVTPASVSMFGLRYLMVLAPVGVVAAVAVHFAISKVPHRSDDAHVNMSSIPRGEHRKRWIAIGILYIGNAARFTVNMSLIYLIDRWAEMRILTIEDAPGLTEDLRESAAQMAGWYLVALTIGSVIGGLGVGAFVRNGREKWAIVCIGLIGVPLVFAFPLVPDSVSFILGIGCGAGFAASVPLTIAVAQRLLPHRTSLASGLMMGGAWAVAAFGPPLGQFEIDSVGMDGAFAVTAGLLVIASLLSILLPGRLLRSIATESGA